MSMDYILESWEAKNSLGVGPFPEQSQKLSNIFKQPSVPADGRLSILNMFVNYNSC